jgi:hypothetical protein
MIGQQVEEKTLELHYGNHRDSHREVLPTLCHVTTRLELQGPMNF